MRTLQRMVVLLAGIGTVSTAGCSESTTEPPALMPIEGTWKGTVRSDTLLLQLVEKPWEIYNMLNISGTGTYTEGATGSRSTFGLFGSRIGPDSVEIWIHAQPNALNYQASVEESRMVGVMWVLLRNTTGDRIVVDSIPLTMIRH